MVAQRFFTRLSVGVLLLFSSFTSAQSEGCAADEPVDTASASVMGNGTYPRANYLSDGSIIGTFTSFVENNNTITVVRSTDNGNSWTEIGTVATGPVATTDINNPYPLQLPSGRIIIAFRNHSLQNGVYTYFRITICYSDDNGATWTYLSQPASDPGPVNGNWEPFLRMSEDGNTVQLYYSRETSSANQESLMRTSTDGGVTWTSANVISDAGNDDTRDGMLGVVQISGDNLIAVFESEENGGDLSIYSITSSDDGATWGNRSSVYAPPTGFVAQAPQVTNVDGILVASFQTNEDNINDTAVKVVTSMDGGLTWGQKTTVFEEPSTWAGLLALSGHSNSFLTMAYRSAAMAQAVDLV